MKTLHTISALLGVLAIFAIGCAGTTYKYIDANGKPVEIKTKWYGRGCVAYDVDKQGNPRIIHSVDATSDWIGGRTVPPLVGLAGALWFRTPGMITQAQGPSEVKACSFLFLDQGEDDDDG